MSTETQTKHQAGSVEIAAKVCFAQGHNLVNFSHTGDDLRCVKCGLTVAEIHKGEIN